MAITVERQLVWIQDDLELATRLSTGQPATRSFAGGYREEDVQIYELSALEVLRDWPSPPPRTSSATATSTGTCGTRSAASVRTGPPRSTRCSQLPARDMGIDDQETETT